MAERNAQFATLVGAAPLGIFLLDADLKVLEVNPTARAVFSSIPELIGQDLESLARRLRPPQSAEKIGRLFRHTLESGTPHLATDRISDRRDRRAVEYYEWQINRIPLRDGGTGWCVTSATARRISPRARRCSSSSASSSPPISRRMSPWRCWRTSCAIRSPRSVT